MFLKVHNQHISWGADLCELPADRGLHAGCKERAGLEYLLVCNVSLWECVKDAKGAPRTVVNMRDTAQC